MSRTIRVWRVEYDDSQPPGGWDEVAADAHPRFALWADSGDGYHEPRDSHIVISRRTNQPYWSPPRRKNFLSRSGAKSLADELEELGVPCQILRSEPVQFEADR